MLVCGLVLMGAMWLLGAPGSPGPSGVIAAVFCAVVYWLAYAASMAVFQVMPTVFYLRLREERDDIGVSSMSAAFE